MELMAKDLNLSAEQQNQMEQVFKTAPPAGGPSGQGMQEMRSKIESILTPAQREKLAAIGRPGAGGRSR